MPILFVILALEPRTLTRWDVQKYARQAYDLGVRYIGGCCGFEPYHIRAIAEEVSSRKRVEKLNFLKVAVLFTFRVQYVGGPSIWPNFQASTLQIFTQLSFHAFTLNPSFHGIQTSHFHTLRLWHFQTFMYLHFVTSILPQFYSSSLSFQITIISIAFRISTLPILLYKRNLKEAS